MRRAIEYLVVALLLVPVLFINIKSSHDWGDDFSQYIHQAQNIVQGVSQNETGYVFNPDVAVIGPKAYPPGFPLLLAPVIAHYGIDYAAMDTYLSVFLLLSCFVGFLLLRPHFSFATALFTTLIIAYNPVTLSFKTEILSDLPFTFLSLLCVYLAQKKEHFMYAALIGLLLGFTYQVRSMGLILLGAIVAQRVITLWRARQLSLANLKYLLLMLLVFELTCLSVKLALPTDSGYPQLFETEQPYTNAVNHLSYHTAALHNFFKDYEIKDYYFIGFICASCLTCFSWLGFFYCVKKKGFDLINVYFACYLITLFAYKFGDSGLRFVYPLLFFLFYYAIIGLKNALKPLSRHTSWMPYAFGFFILFSYKEAIEKMNADKNTMEGPCMPSAQEAFSFIKQHVPADAVIAFEKPRALALYTGRHSVFIKETADAGEIGKQLAAFHAGYILTHALLSPGNKRLYLESDSTLYEPVFDNGTCRLYRVATH